MDPLGKPKVYLIGAGAVGLGLALALRASGYVLTGLFNRGAQRRARAERLLGLTLPAELDARALGAAELVLVCVSDKAIAEVGGAIRGALMPAAVVAHVSGCLAGTELGELGTAARGSCHPLVACTDPEQASKALRGATYGLEGDAEAVALLRQMVAHLHGQAVVLHPGGKARYHAAAVMASNLVVSLLQAAIQEAQEAGFSIGREALPKLALGAVERVASLGPEAALTGPVLRGDSPTIERHLAALSSHAAGIYKLLSAQALALAQARGLPATQAEALARLLEGVD